MPAARPVPLTDEGALVAHIAPIDFGILLPFITRVLPADSLKPAHTRVSAVGTAVHDRAFRPVASVGVGVADNLITAEIAAVTALVTAFITTLGTQYGSLLRERRAEKVAQRGRLDDKRAALDEILSRYRDPLLTAGSALERRIFGICRKEFLDVYLVNGNESQRRYAEEHTLFVMAEYFGWVEIIRREIRFLDLLEIEGPRRVRDALDTIARSFDHDDPSLGMPFMVFLGEQRAIGEIVIRRPASVGGSGRQHECIGFAEFVQRMAEPDFGMWFEELRKHLRTASRRPTVESPRLVAVQHGLVDLIEALDPNALRYAHSRTERL